MSNVGIFPEIIEISAEQGQTTYEKRCKIHERILFHYLERKIDGWNVSDFLTEERIENYALYAVTDFTSLFLKDLEQNNRDRLPEIICDRNAEKYHFKYRNWPIILPDDLIIQYEKNNINKIIVMSILHENEIIAELQKKGVLLNDIISFVSVLYS